MDKVTFGWRMLRTKQFPKLGISMVELLHERTNAKWLHVDTRIDDLHQVGAGSKKMSCGPKLSNDPKANVFSVGFKTPPVSSNGVSHVLEHTALCGSKNFPVRDPFFAMLNRSLAVYMNAWTAPDYTMYPFSTLNAVDYKNLLSVYADAVFFPKLSYYDFLQEGWRVERKNSNSGSINIQAYEFKGIVFNEMKGAMSDPDRIYMQYFNRAMYPGTSYQHNSGGDPLDIITQLDHKTLQEFHASHYTPSNAYFYSYGNFPLEAHLEQIEINVMSNFNVCNNSEICHEKKDYSKNYSEINGTCQDSSRLLDELCVSPYPVKFTVHEEMGPLNTMMPSDEGQIVSSLAWSLASMGEYEIYKNTLLFSLLMSGPSAPLYKSLIATNIGSDYSANSGFDVNGVKPTFSIGLQGLTEDKLELVSNVILKTLDETAELGFEKHRVEAIIHQTELHQRSEVASYGINLIAGLMPYWIRGQDIFKLVDYSEFNKRALLDLCDISHVKGVLKGLLADSTTNGNINLIMRPNAEYNSKLVEMEANILKKMEATFTEDDIRRIDGDAITLKQAQSIKPNFDCLPILPISSITPSISIVEVNIDKSLKSSMELAEIPQITNGLTYFRVAVDFERIDAELVPYIPMYVNFISQLGPNGSTRTEFDSQIKLVSSGISSSMSLVQSTSDIKKLNANIVFSTYFLNSHTGSVLPLFKELITCPNFNEDGAVETLLGIYYNSISTSIADHGHQLAMSLSNKSLSPFHDLNETISGLTNIRFVKSIYDARDIDSLRAKLNDLSDCLLNQCRIKACVTTEADFLPEFKTQFNDIFKNVSFVTKQSNVAANEVIMFPYKNSLTRNCRKNEYHRLDLNVNYNAKSLPGCEMDSTDFAPLKILCNVISSKYLHKKIREEGGAYGGGVTCNNGVVSFYSYRDPNIEDTISAFDGSYDYVLRHGISDEDLHEAKLQLFQKLDAPISPGNKGLGFFLSDLTNESRQLFRDRVFAVTKDDLLEVANKYISSVHNAPSITLGPQQAPELKNSTSFY